MKTKRMIASLLLCLTLVLAGCGAAKSNQEKAGDSMEAMTNFLTDIQEGDFQAAQTYFREGNPLFPVFAAQEGESIPMMDEVYRKFCSQMGEFTFTVEDGSLSVSSSVLVKLEGMDYTTSIENAMAEAIQTQTEEGGDAFQDIAGWLIKGLESGEMGEAGEYDCIMGSMDGEYKLEHIGVPYQEFLNALTGGFYDYADATMTICTGSSDSQEYVDYIAAIGDKVVGYIQTVTEPYDTTTLTEEDIAAFKEMYRAYGDGIDGIYYGVQFGDGTVTMAMGIDFHHASQSALVDAGIVTGKYDTYYGANYLSLSATIAGFEQEGMVCETMPEYGEE